MSKPFAWAQHKSIAIVGSREYPYPGRVRRFVQRLAAICSPETLIVSGDGGRVDKTAIYEAELQGMHWMVFPADWNAKTLPNGKRTYDRGAGFRRNQYIVDQADALVYFWVSPTAGTADDIRKAKKKGIPVVRGK